MLYTSRPVERSEQEPVRQEELLVGVELWRSMSSLLQQERTADADTLITFAMWICHYLEGKKTWSQNFYNSMKVALYSTCMFIGLRSVMPLIDEYRIELGMNGTIMSFLIVTSGQHQTDQ